MGIFFWTKTKADDLAEILPDTPANEPEIADYSTVNSVKSSKTLRRRGTLRRFFSVKRKKQELDASETSDTAANSMVSSPELFNGSYMSFDESRTNQASAFSDTLDQEQGPEDNEYPHLRRNRKKDTTSNYLTIKRPDNKQEQKVSDKPLPIQQMFEQEFANEGNEENLVVQETKQEKKGLRRSLSRLFSKKDKAKAHDKLETGSLYRDQVDPLPNFNFRSLRLNDTINNINRRPDSPNLANVTVFPASSKIMTNFGVESESSTQFEAFEVQKPNKLHLNSVWNVWGEFASKKDEDGGKLRNRVIDKVWKTKQLLKILDSCDELLLSTEPPETTGESRVHFFKFGLSPRYRKEPLLYNSGRVVIRIPSEEIEKVWRSVLDVVLKEKLLWSNLDNNIVGISWKKVATKEEYNLILWLTKEGFDYESVSSLMNEVMLLVTDELKPLFTYSKYYVNANHTYHAIDLKEIR